VQPTSSFRWYTRARRIPLLIGVMSDGTRIPGGPLTLPQALGGIAVGLLALRTAPWWAHHGPVWNVAIFAAAVVGAAWLLGRLPSDGRSVSGRLQSLTSVGTAPRWGRAGHRPIRVPAPRRLRHRIVLGAITPGDASGGRP
jgi:hypothetical protein